MISCERRQREIEISLGRHPLFQRKNRRRGAYEISRTVEVIPESADGIDRHRDQGDEHHVGGRAPAFHLTAMCEGEHETASKYGNSVTHEFVLNNKRMDPDNHKVGTISKKLVSFGRNRRTTPASIGTNSSCTSCW